ncbi:hypothetical protein [Paenibacillus aestuarii]|uniref:Uncharacterized protein n=1 Tax=Paenibacillus aestuarii TaxID=516965 RepID=A0ABW0KCD9_9BACL|nr:hypothetical protein [Paenibacillus aestuarii]
MVDSLVVLPQQLGKIGLERMWWVEVQLKVGRIGLQLLEASAARPSLIK